MTKHIKYLHRTMSVLINDRNKNYYHYYYWYYYHYFPRTFMGINGDNDDWLLCGVVIALLNWAATLLQVYLHYTAVACRACHISEKSITHKQVLTVHALVISITEAIDNEQCRCLKKILKYMYIYDKCTCIYCIWWLHIRNFVEWLNTSSGIVYLSSLASGICSSTFKA